MAWWFSLDIELFLKGIADQIGDAHQKNHHDGFVGFVRFRFFALYSYFAESEVVKLKANLLLRAVESAPWTQNKQIELSDMITSDMFMGQMVRNYSNNLKPDCLS